MGESVLNCTTDDGIFMSYDIRENTNQPFVSINTQKLELYCHSKLGGDSYMFG